MGRDIGHAKIIFTAYGHGISLVIIINMIRILIYGIENAIAAIIVVNTCIGGQSSCT